MLAPDHPEQSHGAKLGFWMCLALVMGTMIGSSIFLLPSSLAPLGWNAVAGWAISMLGVLCMVLVFARLARDMPGGSGPFTYAAAAFGPGAGFTVAWSFWIAVWVSNAALAVAVASNLSELFPILANDQRVMASFALGTIWIVTAINCQGVRKAGGFQLVTASLKILPLIGAMLAAVWLAGSDTAAPAPLSETIPLGLAGVSSAVALTLATFLGFESALAVGDRISEPEITVPRATVIGAAATGIIYFLCYLALVAWLPTAQIAQSHSPFATFFGEFVSPTVGNVIALFGAIAALGTLNGLVLQQGEVLLPLARGAMAPRWLATESARGIPVRIHLLSSGLASLLVLANFTKGVSGLYKFMMLVTTSVTIIFYIAGALAALKFVRDGRIAGSPGFVTLAIVSTCYAGWAFYGVGLEPSIWSLALTLSGLPIYWFATRSGAAQQPTE